MAKESLERGSTKSKNWKVMVDSLESEWKLLDKCLGCDHMPVNKNS